MWANRQALLVYRVNKQNGRVYHRCQVPKGESNMDGRTGPLHFANRVEGEQTADLLNGTSNLTQQKMWVLPTFCGLGWRDVWWSTRRGAPNERLPFGFCLRSVHFTSVYRILPAFCEFYECLTFLSFFFILRRMGKSRPLQLETRFWGQNYLDLV